MVTTQESIQTRVERQLPRGRKLIRQDDIAAINFEIDAFSRCLFVPRPSRWSCCLCQRPSFTHPSMAKSGGENMTCFLSEIPREKPIILPPWVPRYSRVQSRHAVSGLDLLGARAKNKRATAGWNLIVLETQSNYASILQL